MAPQRCRPRGGGPVVWLFLVTLLSFCTKTLAQNTQWIQYTGNDGTIWLNDDRQPALYTNAFGGCQEDSLINITRFDAAYYKDNMTVLFHLAGNSALTNQSLMLYISVYAYGESRFNLTFNPCNTEVNGLCPLNSSVPIEANGIIPVGAADVANIPSIALTIPDFEGQAILRIFANSTESQIACFSAVVTNGSSFSHPAAVGTILGIFALIAMIASLAVAIYGQAAPEMRKHYAHSISVLVVFAVYQHIFFTGVLSMNWPSVLVAFWSNYAWSAGMIYNKGMQDSINKFIGNDRGNISVVGSAPTGENAIGLGGGFSISQIYRRAIDATSGLQQDPESYIRAREVNDALVRRDLANASSGFSWYGRPVQPGLPLPGNYSGFAGTLAELNIPASNAFITGFLWLLILIALIAGFIACLKWSVEGLCKAKLLKTQRFAFFRQHWLDFMGAAVLRIAFIGFFMIMVLALFQFTLGGGSGPLAIAGVVFALFLVGMFGIAAYALWYRLRYETFVKPGEQLRVKRSDASLPSLKAPSTTTDEKPEQESEQAKESVITVPWWRMHFTDRDTERPHPHDDTDYIQRFGWLAGRYRRSKWWFFSLWLVYELVRACFYGGAAGHALTQVFGLLIWEILAFIAVILLRPFESSRLNLLMVYLLGFSKVSTVALSSAFDEKFGLGRILTTVIGVVIIVIQGILTICLLIGIILGAISSYLSLTRNHDTLKPQSWLPRRERYFKHVDQKATDKPAPPPPPPPRPESPKEPYFSVSAVRRQPKIEDEGGDEEHEHEHCQNEQRSVDQLGGQPPSRTMSMRSSHSNLPYGARRHRASWSTRDFLDMDAEQLPSGLQSRMSIEDSREMANRHRAASLKGQTGPDMKQGSESPLPRANHRRTASNPLKTQRNSSIVNEETETDAGLTNS